MRNLSYVQGQSPSSNTREYFYYIDHQGQVLKRFNNSCIFIINKDSAQMFVASTLYIIYGSCDRLALYTVVGQDRDLQCRFY